MRITPEQVIFEHYSGIYTTGDFTPKVQSSAKEYDSAADLMERGKLIKPLYDIGEDSMPGIFARYTHAPDEYLQNNAYLLHE